eukprot:scaffold4849_cov202-Prasinococcus_capsulatus_cf.AAC.4
MLFLLLQNVADAKVVIRHTLSHMREQLHLVLGRMEARLHQSLAQRLHALCCTSSSKQPGPEPPPPNRPRIAHHEQPHGVGLGDAVARCSAR